MKNVLLFLALVWSSPMFAQTQLDAPSPEAPKPKFRLEVIGGLSINNMPYRPNFTVERGSINSLLKPEMAYFGGVSARQPITNRLGVKMDVQLAVRGYDLKNEFWATNSLERYRATYIDFAPQMDMRVFKNVYLSLGGYTGILLKERLKINGQDWSEPSPLIGNLAEDLDWGLATGLRIEFGWVSALVKYQHGLAKATKLEITDDTGGFTPVNQFHRSLQVGLGFQIL
jgi:hypothetical protein